VGLLKPFTVEGFSKPILGVSGVASMFAVYHWESAKFVVDKDGDVELYATMVEAEDVADKMQMTQNGLWLAVDYKQ